MDPTSYLHCFFDELCRLGIPHLILHGYEDDFAQVTQGGDLDFCARDNDHRMARILHALAAATGFVPINCIAHEWGCHAYVLTNGTSTLKLDCHGDFRYRGRILLTHGRLMSRRIRCKGFWVLAPETALLYKVLKGILKKNLGPRQLVQIHALMNQAPAHSLAGSLVPFLHPGQIQHLLDSIDQNQGVPPHTLAAMALTIKHRTRHRPMKYNGLVYTAGWIRNRFHRLQQASGLALWTRPSIFAAIQPEIQWGMMPGEHSPLGLGRFKTQLTGPKSTCPDLVLFGPKPGQRLHHHLARRFQKRYLPDSMSCPRGDATGENFTNP